MSPRYTLSILSQAERLTDIADFIETAGRASGLKPDQIYDVEMAVDEACTNIIQHAYHGRKNGTIDITCERRHREFIITIRDYGDRFDPKKVVPPRVRVPLSQRAVGGLGLPFMHKLMDRVEFDFSSKNGNRLTMAKKL